MNSSSLTQRCLVAIALVLTIQLSFAADAVWPRMLSKQRIVDESVLPVDGGLRWPDGAMVWGSRDVSDGSEGSEGNRLDGNGLNGAGRLQLLTGYRYEGDFYQGWLHGRGSAFGPGGEQYSGHWEKGMPDGYGEWKDALGNQYKGHWKAGRREGSGEFTWASGSHYQGQWLDDQPNGLGRWSTSTGDRYVGDFQHGKPHGKGVMHWSDESQYAGAFVAGEGHGEGHCVRDMKLVTCTYVEGILTRADPLTVEPTMNVSMIAVNNRDQTMVPIVLEQAFWQSYGAMLSRQVKIFTSAQLGEGLHFTVDDYTGPGRYELGAGDIYAVLPMGDKTYEIGHMDNVKAVVNIVDDNNSELSGQFTVWWRGEGDTDSDSSFAGVTFRNGQFRAVKWE